MTGAKGVANGSPIGLTVAKPEVAAGLSGVTLSTFGEELHVRVGGDRRIKIGAEYRLAVELARELVDDLARDRLPVLILALTRLHNVRHQRLDLDEIAFLGFLRKLQPRFFRHVSLLNLCCQPPQPPMVTFTSFWAVKNSPLLVLATTTMFCVVASRMRVEASALPDMAEKWNVATPGLGLPSATTMTSLT